MSFRNAYHADYGRRVRAARWAFDCEAAVPPAVDRVTVLRQRTGISRRPPSTVQKIRQSRRPAGHHASWHGGRRPSAASPPQPSRAPATCRSAQHSAAGPNRSSYRRHTATTSRRRANRPLLLGRPPGTPDSAVGSAVAAHALRRASQSDLLALIATGRWWLHCLR